MKTIEWRDIPGYEGLYQISNNGDVKCLPKIIKYGWYKNRVVEQKEMIKKPSISKQGYLRVPLTKNGKNRLWLIHRLVAIAFIPNPNNYPCVNHKDENPKNNSVDNLEWCTTEYNLNYGTRNKRISENMMGIKNTRSKPVLCQETGEIFASAGEAGRMTNIDSSHIRHCCLGHRMYVGGYSWKYI